MFTNCRTILAVSAIALGLSSHQNAWSQEVLVAEHIALVEVIREVRVETPRPGLDAAELFSRSESLAGSLDFLFHVLESRKVPRVGGLPPQTLSEAQANLILTAMEFATPQEIRTVRDRRLAELKATHAGSTAEYVKASARARIAAVQVSGILKETSSVDFLFRHALLPDEPELSATSERIFEDALCRLLSANTKCAEQLETSWYGGQPSLIVPALRAAGRSGRTECLGFIEEVVRWSPENILAASAQIRVLGPSTLRAQNEVLAQALVEQLDQDDPALCIGVSQALGGLRSESGIEALIGLLEYEPQDRLDGSAETTQRRVQDMALWALQEITTRPFPCDPDLWKLWLSEEKLWVRDSSSHWVKRLESDDIAVCAEAIRVLSKRRYGRDDFALAIAELLATGSEAIKPMACIALGDLGSMSGVPALLLAMESSGEQTLEAAWMSIRRLTGKELPRDWMACRAELPEELAWIW